MQLMNKTGTLLVATLATFAIGGWRASAATLELFPVADTYIFNLDTTISFGGANPLLVGISATENHNQRCLFRFSLDSLPPDAVISAANLRLIAVKGARGANDFDLNRMLVNWTE